MAVETGLLPDRYAGPQPVGHGGMGEIYRATDTALGRAVAVKVLAERYSLDAAVRERFTREALAAARLSGNRNIVTIFDVGEHNDRPFIVMEYLAGGSLEQRLQSGVVPARLALDWLEQTAGALDAAHAAGVVHRDVKPANLLLDRLDTVHVADFGIASAAGLDSLTQTGTVLGTASYLSPEQAKGERTTPASDRYSLGIVAFELLTGKRPFEGDSVAAEATAHVTGVVPSVSNVNPDAPGELDPVFARALAKDPAGRYASCAEFVAALRDALQDAAGATRVAEPWPMPPRSSEAPPAIVYPAPPTAPPPRRRAWLIPVVALLALLAIGGGIAAATLGGGGGDKQAAPPVSVKTVTQQGRTVTVPAPTTTPAPPTTEAPPAAGQNGDALNAQAFELMRRGDFAGALPLLQQAVQALQGQNGNVSNGYANFNLGVTLIRLGRCSDAVPYLEAAKQLEPGRHEVHDALKIAQQCGGGGGGRGRD